MSDFEKLEITNQECHMLNMIRGLDRPAAMVKLHASRTAEKVCSMAVDFYGDNGFSIEYPVEKFFGDAKIGQIYEGTSNLQLQTIAKWELAN